MSRLYITSLYYCMGSATNHFLVFVISHRLWYWPFLIICPLTINFIYHVGSVTSHFLLLEPYSILPYLSTMQVLIQVFFFWLKALATGQFYYFSFNTSRFLLSAPHYQSFFVIWALLPAVFCHQFLFICGRKFHLSKFMYQTFCLLYYYPIWQRKSSI